MDYTDIVFDSRLAKPGTLFVAIPETGGKFISDARAKGAAVISFSAGAADTARELLAYLSAKMFGFPANSMTLIGVTGTSGKTTVTTLAKQVYELLTGEKAGLIGTVQNLIGDEELPAKNTTPESRELQELLAQMRDKGCKAVFMEVSSHALAMSRVYGLRFKVGVFNNISHEHLDYHKTMDAYLAAKLKLFGMSEICIAGAEIEISTERKPLIRYDGSDNKRAVLEIFKALGFNERDILTALEKAKQPKGRSEIVPTPGKDYTVIIDYAHKPGALEFVLNKTRKDYPNRKLTVLFGCGGDRDAAKRPEMGRIASRLADFVIITSDNPRTENPRSIIADISRGADVSKTITIENRSDAIKYALDNAEPGAVILLAGKGHEDYQIIGREKLHLDEREIIKLHLRGK
ncbi:MAG: UDP-N-acetylmuramoyl-L-alanyl-D-glutamate--2,6-diaminopimelate ligase [Oscillospiraceae bacterium]|jgi:UDP-N-acetylmuramoyl-L-alanyl-D-glutamate--2,6-diaminopimelate ligase|nr:UDP-N-acetylmuramoyl-L-alanyl-D-glutamate--2,6-diaminopimelate ligase [Oscillospiraceae bacterium]